MRLNMVGWMYFFMFAAHLVTSQKPPCDSIPPQQNAKLAEKSNYLFQGLSSEETNQVVEYLINQTELNLTHAINTTINSNHIYSIENFIPKKSQVVEWLDGGRRRPTRMARAILFMGERKEILELLIAPIPNPNWHTEAFINRKPGSKILWNSRPVGAAEGPIVSPALTTLLEPLNPLLNKMVSNYCNEFLECGTYLYLPRASMDSDRRHLVVMFSMSPTVFKAYYVLPLPLQLILTFADEAEEQVIIREVYYNGNAYSSVDELVKFYENNPSELFILPELNTDLELFGAPDFIDLDETADDVRRPPVQFYPDGQRFRIDGHYIEWLQWSFNIHTRTIAGLQLFDVRHGGERIAYEISIQDIAVVYSGEQPDNYFKTLLDNGFGAGRLSSPLIRGVDCPEGSVYLNATVYATEFDEDSVITDAICIFEHRNSVPIRRHYSGDGTGSHRFAFSMPDSVLIVRQILTVTNYDYIYDLEMHQNGVIEAKVSSTGYIQIANNIASGETKYGMLLNPAWRGVGLLHQHLFNFKFDVDIGGTSNRFKTMNFGYERTDSKFSNGEPWYIPVVNEMLVENEKDAKIRFYFNKPKQYIIYKDCAEANKIRYGYRIHSNSFVKLLLPEDSPMAEGGLSWAKYQVAVTKHDDNERSTTSYFGQGNIAEPDVNFDNFADNDSILDTDLVAWVTVGLNHLPNNEDMPVTTTPGKTLTASLFPFNYFKRDVSIHSRDGTIFYNAFNSTDDYLHWNESCAAEVTEPEINAPLPLADLIGNFTEESLP